METWLCLGISITSLIARLRKLNKCAVFDVIYQTREGVFHQDIQTPRSGLAKRGAAEFF